MKDARPDLVAPEIPNDRGKHAHSAGGGRMSGSQHGLKEAGVHLGERIRRLRHRAGLSLQEVAQRSNVSLSAISKIEKAQVAPTFDTLLRIARGLDMTFEEMFTDRSEGAPGSSALPVPTGRLAITRTGATRDFSTTAYDYAVYAHTLRAKLMTPLRITVKARQLDEPACWSSHPGEEFIYVLSGAIEVRTEIYNSIRLETGEAAYIDSGMLHTFLSVSREDAQILSMCCSGTMPDTRASDVAALAASGG